MNTREMVNQLRRLACRLEPFGNETGQFQSEDARLVWAAAERLWTGPDAFLLLLSETMAFDMCWIEINAGGSRDFIHPCTCYMAPYADDTDPTVISEWAGGRIYLDADAYGVDWRCWSSRPTDEQREAAAWAN